MSVWDKLTAAIGDLSTGGQIGSLLSGSSRHEDSQSVSDEPDNEVPFAMGVILLSAKMAKADGIVTGTEVIAFKNAFKVSAEEMKLAARAFNLAKQDVAGYESCAEQLVTTFKGNRKLLEDVLEGLFHIAKSDESLHPQEEHFLSQVAKLFGFTDSEFNYMKARHVVAGERNFYSVLGVKPSIGNEELKNHYRRILADNCPDELMKRGVPKEFVTIATERVAAIEKAYNAIAKCRGI
jgi:DnaJ like chaperone protein